MPTKRKRRTNTEETRTIVVGIDYGTTYSGISWALSSRPDLLGTVTRWDSLLPFNNEKEKTPSVISYAGHDQSPRWGYNVALDRDSLVRFAKLLLVDSNDLPEHVRGSWPLVIAKRACRDRVALDVVADYLRGLWHHWIADVERTLGPGVIDECHIRIIMSLPAIWPPYAQSRMQEAARRAGMLEARDSLSTALGFVSEPEAAALASFDDLSDQVKLNHRDHFVVCDAGGGTVDVITYSVASKNPLRVNESIKGDGALCGAVFLDERFRTLLKDTVGSSVWRKLDSEAIERLIHQEWENGIKSQFLNDSQEWHIRISPSSSRSDKYFAPFQIDITSEMMLSVFDPMVKEVIRLLDEQFASVKQRYRKVPKYVVLVGGLGKSQYLYQQLKAHFGQKSHVIQTRGERPWSAISRGAGLFGLMHEDADLDSQVSVKNRVARSSYGTTCNIFPWEADEHDPEDREWSQEMQGYWARDQTRWFLQSGGVIQPKPIKLRFWQTLEKPGTQLCTEIIMSDTTPPPARCDENVRRLCVIKWTHVQDDFDSEDDEPLPTVSYKNGREVREVHYQVHMSFCGASLKFAVVYRGREVGSEHVVVDFRNGGECSEGGRIKFEAD